MLSKRFEGWAGLRRLDSLRQDWPDALRMVVSSVLAGTVSSLLHLPEMYWAVLSAVIVSRPGAGGSTKAGASRLIGTVFGSAVAMAVIGARVWHVPEVALLAIAMVLLGACFGWRPPFSRGSAPRWKLLLTRSVTMRSWMRRMTTSDASYVTWVRS